MLFLFALTAVSRSVYPSGDRVFLVPASLLLAGILVSNSSPIPAAGRIELGRLAAAALLLAAFLLLRPSDSSRLLFYLSSLALGAGLVIYGIQLRGGISPTGVPLTATYINRNHLAGLLGFILPPAACFSLGSKNRAVAWISRAALPVLLGGILLTKSRGGIAGAAAALAALGLIFIFNFRRGPGPGQVGRRRWGVILATIILLLALAAASIYVWFQLPESFPITAPHPEVLSIRTRLSIWRGTWGIFLSRPITGWGWGTFSHLYPSFREAGVWYTVPHAHNELLQLLAEGGVIGFSLVAFSLVLALRELVKRYSLSPGSVSGLLALGTAGSLVFSAVHSGFDFIFRLPANALFLAALTGLALSGGAPQSISSRSARSRPGLLLWGLAVSLVLVIFLFIPVGRFYRSEFVSREGERLLAAGRADEARETFTRAARIDPSSSRPLLGRAEAGIAVFDRAENRVGLYASILDDLEAARRINPRDSGPLRRLIRFHRDLGALEKAGGYLEEALALQPRNAYFLYELAGIELRRGEYLPAARRFRRAVEIYPMLWNPSRKLLFGHTRDYEILKELPPREGKFHRLMGYYLLLDQDVDGARKEFEIALELAPEEAENWRAMGRYYVRTGSPEEAVPFYRRALARAPENHQWLVELGDIHRECDRVEEALELYLRARGLAPARRDYSDRAGAAILALRGVREAIDFWWLVAGEDPGWPRPYFLRARLFLEDGQPEAAEKEIGRALSRAPDNRHYLNLKARIERIRSRGPGQ